jgi:transcriptional regulator GlxA family with amidase domain
MFTQQQTRLIAFVIYPGLTLLDLVGPLGVLQKYCKLRPYYQTTVVAEWIEPIASDNGLTVIPDRTFEQVPHPYAVFVPGGGPPTLRAMTNPVLRNYLKLCAETSTYVGSVCTGALLLGSLGLLDGKDATTHWAYFKILESFGARYQRKRWVDNGKIINSAGVSAGIDMGLFFISKLEGDEMAKKVQRLIEYDPQPPFKIEWNRLPLMARFMRSYHSLAAPWLTSGAKKLLRAGQ